ncbi:MAG: SLBB domain-containing protein [Acidobacteriota bacterium]
MRIKYLFLCAALVAFAGMASAQTAPQASAIPQGYLLGPGDVISIKALGEPSFDVESLTVDDDGKIMIPYSDTPLTAKCKTERELQSEVIKVWTKYLKKPQISLRVTQRNSRPPVSIYGEVQKPQQFPLTRRLYLMEVISFAGGQTDKSGGMVQVFRTRGPMCGEGDPSTNWTVDTEGVGGLPVPSKIFSLATLAQTGDDSNPEILPGDIVLLTKASPIYVVGEVMKPGEISLPDGGLPLTQALAMALGATREAKKKGIKIYRRKPGSATPDVIIANYEQIAKGLETDIVLQPFDIVEVGKAPKSFTDYLIEFATGVPNRIPLGIR